MSQSFDLADLKRRMDGAIAAFKGDLAGLRTGRASPSLLDPIMVEAYGPQMPINQSHELHAAYKKLGLDVYFDVVHGARHGGDQFYAPEHLMRALEFLNRTIVN